MARDPLEQFRRFQKMFDQLPSLAVPKHVQMIAALQRTMNVARFAEIEHAIGESSFSALLRSITEQSRAFPEISAVQLPAVFETNAHLANLIAPNPALQSLGMLPAGLKITPPDFLRHVANIDGLLAALDLAEQIEADEGTERSTETFADLEHHGRIVLADQLDLEALDGLSLPEAQREASRRTKWVTYDVVDKVLREPKLLREIDPRDFEKLIAEILDRLGFINITLTPPSGDGGVDVIATRVTAGFPIVMYFQCKRYGEGTPVTLDAIRALLGVTLIEHKANLAVMVTTTRFTRGERELIANTIMLDSRDYDGVVGWLNEAWPEG